MPLFNPQLEGLYMISLGNYLAERLHWLQHLVSQDVSVINKLLMYPGSWFGPFCAGILRISAPGHLEERDWN